MHDLPDFILTAFLAWLAGRALALIAGALIDGLRDRRP